VTRRDLENSDHTFSRAEWSHAVNRWTLAWVKGQNGPRPEPVNRRNIRTRLYRCRRGAGVGRSA
jgi:hypothetical protein